MKRASRYLLLLAFSMSLGTFAVGCRAMKSGVGTVAKFGNMTNCACCGDCCECQDGECGSGYCDTYPRRWTQEWYEREVGSPVGSRQSYRFGQYWPPYPRPQGKKQHYSETFHAAHYWPHPYNCQDMSYVHETSARQIANGWRNEGTLYVYHFDTDTNELTHTGRNHLRWILDWVPEQHRTIWVQRGLNSQIDEMRLASIRKAAEGIVAADSVPDIILRTAFPPGRPADEIQTIRDLELSSMPTPRIEGASSTSSDTGSGGGGGEEGDGEI